MPARTVTTASPARPRSRRAPTSRRGRNSRRSTSGPPTIPLPLLACAKLIEYSDTEISVLRARVAEALTEADRLLSQLSDDGSVIGDAVERIHEGVAQSDEAAVIRLDTKALADRAEVAQAPDITIADAVDTLGLQAAERGLWIGVALAYRVLAGVPATGITNGAR